MKYPKNPTSFAWKLGAGILMAIVASACNGPSGPLSPDQAALLPDTSSSDPKNPDLEPLPTPADPTDPPTDPVTPPKRTYATDVLLFNGSGVSTSDWQNTELIVKSMGLSYRLVNTSQMNAMTLDQLANFGTIVVPGGSGGTIYQSLTAAARLRIRQAVRDHGVGYVGFCAGAWVAVGPESDTNSTASYGFAVAEGDELPYYWPGGNTNLVAAMVNVNFADGSSRELVWWGGPATPEWKDGVIARYVTGAPAISQTRSGKGFVVISGPHPEAPQGWRSTAGYDSDGLDYDIAIEMIEASLSQQPMIHF